MLFGDYLYNNKIMQNYSKNLDQDKTKMEIIDTNTLGIFRMKS